MLASSLLQKSINNVVILPGSANGVIAATADNAIMSAGTVRLLGDNGPSLPNIGMFGQDCFGNIFRGLNIPKGATLKTAKFRMYYGYTGYYPGGLTSGYDMGARLTSINVVAAASHAAFSLSENINTRLTGAFKWNNNYVYGHYAWIDHNILTILQQLVNQSYWNVSTATRDINIIMKYEDNHTPATGSSNGGTRVGMRTPAGDASQAATLTVT